MENELMERVSKLIEKLDRPAVPLDDQLWDHADVARYFKRHPRTVRETITSQASFPKAIRLPSDGRSHPLYNAGEVVEWARRYKEKH